MNSALSTDAIRHFIINGYVKIDQAFSAETAARAREILWRDLDCDPNDRSTWTKPVVRLGMYPHEPFQQAANTRILHDAFDQLVGPDRWIPCQSVGTFPVRFPSAEDPGDTGWHVDVSFPGADAGNYFEWRVNVKSRGRALLMLFLFSDVGEKDAPTRLRAGSHTDIAHILSDKGEHGLSFLELAEQISSLPVRREVAATGAAGTVYLCHPFLVHAAQKHHGTEPRFVAQPPLLLKNELNLQRMNGNYSPLEQSILNALS